MLLLSFAPAIILLQFCFNPLYKIYSLECISEPACFSLKYIKYCISCITVYTYTIKKRRNGFPFRRRLSKNPGVDKGLQPLMFNPALTTCASERMKTQRFSYFAGFAARELMREAKPVKTRKSGVQPLFRQLQWRRLSASTLFYSPTFFIITTLSFTDISYCAETSHSGVPPI